jgi:hypothetical protein
MFSSQEEPMFQRRVPASWLSALVLVSVPFVLGTLLVLALGRGYDQIASSLYGLTLRYYELPIALFGLGASFRVDLLPSPLVLGAAVFYSILGVVIHTFLAACVRALRSAVAGQQIRHVG